MGSFSDGQDVLYNANTLNAWLSADMHGEEQIMKFYERRFLIEFKIAFDTWIKLDPMNNDQAQPGRCICQNIIVQKWMRQIT